MPKSQSFFNLYLSSVDVGLVVVDHEDMIRLVNKTFTNLIGSDVESLQHQHYRSILPQAEEPKALIQDLVEGRQDHLATTKIWWKNPDSFIYIKGYAKDEVSDQYGPCRIIFLRDVGEEVLNRERLDYQASVLQNVSDSIIVTDREGKITYLNEVATELFGLSRRELLHLSVQELHPDIDVQAFIAKADQQPDYVRTWEWAYQYRGHQRIWLNVKLSPHLRGREVRGMIVMLVDISKKKEYEQDLFRQQEELTSLVNSQTNYLIRTDLEGYFTYANPAFIQRFHQFEDIIGQFSLETILPEDHEKTYKMVEECLAHPGKMVPIEIRKPAPKGEHYVNYWEFVAITDEQGNPTEIQGVGYEITEKKKQDRALYRQKQELSSIVDSQTNYLIRTDLEGNYTFANPAFVKKFEHYGDVIGKPYFPTIHPDDVEKAQKMAETCLSQPGKMVPLEIRKPKPDKGYYTNYWEFIAITDEQGNPTELQGVGYDISERKRNEQRIVNLNELNHLLLNISTRFIQISYQDLDEMIPEALQSVTEFTGFERAFVFLFNADKSLAKLSYQYSAPGTPPFSDEEQAYQSDAFPWWTQQVLSVEVTQIPRVDELPEEAQQEQKMFEHLGVKSIVSVPIVYQDDHLGYIGFSSSNEYHQWNGESIGLLKLLGAIFANSLHRANQEKALEESNRQYKLLADNISDMVSRLDLNMKLNYVSPSVSSLLGWLPVDVLNTTFTDWVHPGDIIPLEEALQQIEQQGDGRFVARMSHKKGGYLWVETTCRTLISGKDEVEIIAVTRNIQSQKVAEQEKERLLQETQAINEELNASEEELRQNLEYSRELNERLTTSERHFKGLIEKSFDAIVVYNEEGYIKYASPSAVHITGYPEMVGMHGTSFVIEEDLPEAERINQQIMELPGEQFSFEQRLRRQDGTVIWIEAVMTNQLQDEAIKGLVSNFRDITDRKQALQSLEDNRISLNIAQKVSKVGSWEKDLSSGKALWSEEFYHILGLDPEEHRPEQVDTFQMIHPEDRDAVRLRNNEVNNELKEIPISYRIIDAKGRLKFVDALNKVIRDKNGKAIKMIGTVQDVTRETELAKLLEETSRIAKVGGWEFDLFDNKLTWTEETYRIYKLPLDEPLSVEKALDFFHPEDRPIINSAFKKLLEEGVPYELELRLINYQGNVKWVRTSGGAYDTKEGVISKVRGAFQDITEKKARVEKLRQYSERLSLAVTTARIGIWELDLAANKLDWNDQQLAIYGISREQFEEDYNYWKTLVHPDDVEAADAEIGKVMEGENVYEVEFRIIRPSGELRYINASAQSVLNEHGQIIKLIGVNLDVTNIRKSEQNARAYNQRLSLATEAAQIGVWDLDVRSGHLIWDERTCRQYGVTPEEFNGSFEEWRQRVHPDDIEGVTHSFNEALEQGKNYEAVFRAIRADTGETRYIRAFAAVVSDGKSDNVSMIGVSWDITDQKENEQSLIKRNEDLQKVNSELDHFVYSTSHNLRAPLTSVMGIVQILGGAESEEERQQYIGLIDKSIHKLDETIQEISDYSRNSRIALQPTSVDIRQLILEIKESLTFMENASLLRYEVEVPEGLEFYSDISRVKIIFNNLLSNAVKYMRANISEPYLRIHISEALKGINIAVEDNGIGIKQEYLERSFEMFFRATNQATGSGLGLYIVKEAVSRLGGRISISSEINKGTRFDVYLPNLQ